MAMIFFWKGNYGSGVPLLMLRNLSYIRLVAQ